MNASFTFDSGRLCLDFFATLIDRDGAAKERLTNPQDLTDWFECAGLSTAEIKVSSKQLSAAVELREGAYEVVTAILSGQKPLRTSVDCVNHWASQSGFVPALDDDGCAATWFANDLFAASLAQIARDLIELLTGSDLHRIRECSCTACSMLFIDTSRAQNRRWCAMERCGNRSKKAEFRRRHAAG